jgi:hypothetical protein
MRFRQRGSALGSIVGIVACGGLGGVLAWALVTASGLQGTPAALVAAVAGMGVAFAAWAGGTALLRSLGWIS